MTYQTKHMKRASGKAFSCPWLFIHLLFDKKLYNWEKTHPTVIALLMANIVRTMSIPLIHIKF